MPLTKLPLQDEEDAALEPEAVEQPEPSEADIAKQRYVLDMIGSKKVNQQQVDAVAKNFDTAYLQHEGDIDKAMRSLYGARKDYTKPTQEEEDAKELRKQEIAASVKRKEMTFGQYFKRDKKKDDQSATPLTARLEDNTSDLDADGFPKDDTKLREYYDLYKQNIHDNDEESAKKGLAPDHFRRLYPKQEAPKEGVRANILVEEEDQKALEDRLNGEKVSDVEDIDQYVQRNFEGKIGKQLRDVPEFNEAKQMFERDVQNGVITVEKANESLQRIWSDLAKNQQIDVNGAIATAFQDSTAIPEQFKKDLKDEDTVFSFDGRPVVLKDRIKNDADFIKTYDAIDAAVKGGKIQSEDGNMMKGVLEKQRRQIEEATADEFINQGYGDFKDFMEERPGMSKYQAMREYQKNYLKDEGKEKVLSALPILGKGAVSGLATLIGGTASLLAGATSGLVRVKGFDAVADRYAESPKRIDQATNEIADMAGKYIFNRGINPNVESSLIGQGVGVIGNMIPAIRTGLINGTKWGMYAITGLQEYGGDRAQLERMYANDPNYADMTPDEIEKAKQIEAGAQAITAVAMNKLLGRFGEFNKGKGLIEQIKAVGGPGIARRVAYLAKEVGLDTFIKEPVEELSTQAAGDIAGSVVRDKKFDLDEYTNTYLLTLMASGPMSGMTKISETNKLFSDGKRIGMANFNAAELASFAAKTKAVMAGKFLSPEAKAAAEERAKVSAAESTAAAAQTVAKVKKAKVATTDTTIAQDSSTPQENEEIVEMTDEAWRVSEIAKANATLSNQHAAAGIKSIEDIPAAKDDTDLIERLVSRDPAISSAALSDLSARAREQALRNYVAQGAQVSPETIKAMDKGIGEMSLSEISRGLDEAVPQVDAKLDEIEIPEGKPEAKTPESVVPEKKTKVKAEKGIKEPKGKSGFPVIKDWESEPGDKPTQKLLSHLNKIHGRQETSLRAYGFSEKDGASFNRQGGKKAFWTWNNGIRYSRLQEALGVKPEAKAPGAENETANSIKKFNADMAALRAKLNAQKVAYESSDLKGKEAKAARDEIDATREAIKAMEAKARDIKFSADPEGHFDADNPDTIGFQEDVDAIAASPDYRARAYEQAYKVYLIAEQQKNEAGELMKASSTKLSTSEQVKKEIETRRQILQKEVEKKYGENSKSVKILMPEEIVKMFGPEAAVQPAFIDTASGTIFINARYALAIPIKSEISNFIAQKYGHEATHRQLNSLLENGLMTRDNVTALAGLIQSSGPDFFNQLGYYNFDHFKDTYDRVLRANNPKISEAEFTAALNEELVAHLGEVFAKRYTKDGLLDVLHSSNIDKWGDLVQDIVQVEDKTGNVQKTFTSTTDAMSQYAFQINRAARASTVRLNNLRRNAERMVRNYIKNSPFMQGVAEKAKRQYAKLPVPRTLKEEKEVIRPIDANNRGKLKDLRTLLKSEVGMDDEEAVDATEGKRKELLAGRNENADVVAARETRGRKTIFEGGIPITDLTPQQRKAIDDYATALSGIQNLTGFELLDIASGKVGDIRGVLKKIEQTSKEAKENTIALDPDLMRLFTSRLPGVEGPKGGTGFDSIREMARNHGYWWGSRFGGQMGISPAAAEGLAEAFAIQQLIKWKASGRFGTTKGKSGNVDLTILNSVPQTENNKELTGLGDNAVETGMEGKSAKSQFKDGKQFIQQLYAAINRDFVRQYLEPEVIGPGKITKVPLIDDVDGAPAGDSDSPSDNVATIEGETEADRMASYARALTAAIYRNSFEAPTGTYTERSMSRFRARLNADMAEELKQNFADIQQLRPDLWEELQRYNKWKSQNEQGIDDGRLDISDYIDSDGAPGLTGKLGDALEAFDNTAQEIRDSYKKRIIEEIQDNLDADRQTNFARIGANSPALVYAKIMSDPDASQPIFFPNRGVTRVKNPDGSYTDTPGMSVTVKDLIETYVAMGFGGSQTRKAALNRAAKAVYQRENENNGIMDEGGNVLRKAAASSNEIIKITRASKTDNASLKILGENDDAFSPLGVTAAMNQMSSGEVLGILRDYFKKYGIDLNGPRFNNKVAQQQQLAEHGEDIATGRELSKESQGKRTWMDDRKKSKPLSSERKGPSFNRDRSKEPGVPNPEVTNAIAEALRQSNMSREELTLTQLFDGIPEKNIRVITPQEAAEAEKVNKENAKRYPNLSALNQKITDPIERKRIANILGQVRTHILGSSMGGGASSDITGGGETTRIRGIVDELQTIPASPVQSDRGKGPSAPEFEEANRLRTKPLAKRSAKKVLEIANSTGQEITGLRVSQLLDDLAGKYKPGKPFTIDPKIMKEFYNEFGVPLEMQSFPTTEPLGNRWQAALKERADAEAAQVKELEGVEIPDNEPKKKKPLQAKESAPTDQDKANAELAKKLSGLQFSLDPKASINQKLSYLASELSPVIVPNREDPGYVEKLTNLVGDLGQTNALSNETVAKIIENQRQEDAKMAQYGTDFSVPARAYPPAARSSFDISDELKKKDSDLSYSLSPKEIATNLVAPFRFMAHSPEEVRQVVVERSAARNYGMAIAKELQTLLTQGGTGHITGITLDPSEADETGRIALTLALKGEKGMTRDKLSPGLRAIHDKVRQILTDVGQARVDRGEMSQETFDFNKDKYLPEYYYNREAKELQNMVGQVLANTDSDQLQLNKLSAWGYKQKGGMLVVDNKRGKRIRSRKQAVSALNQVVTKEAFGLYNSSRTQKVGLKEFIKLIQAKNADANAAWDSVRSKYAVNKPLTFDEKVMLMKDQDTGQLMGGMIIDPAYIIPRAIATAFTDQANAEFLDNAGDALLKEGGVITPMEYEKLDPSEKKKWHKLMDHEKRHDLAPKKYGEILTGNFIKESVYKEIADPLELPGTIMKWYDRGMMGWKSAKTKYNPVTWTHNAISDSAMAFIAGNSPWYPGNWNHYSKAIGDIWNGGDDYAEALKLGVIAGNFSATELTKGYGEEMANLLKNMSAKDKNAMFEALIELNKKVGRGYDFSESVTKLSTYYSYLADGMSKQEAAREVRKYFPYYDMTPKTQTFKWIKRTVMPFASFAQQTGKIGENIVRQIPGEVKNLATDAVNLEMGRVFKNAWHSKSARLGLVLGLPMLMTQAFKGMYGADDDDLESVYERYGQLLARMNTGLLPIREGQGYQLMFDASSLNPFGAVLGFRNSSDIINPERLVERLLNYSAVTDQLPLVQALQIVAGFDPMTGSKYTVDKYASTRNFAKMGQKLWFLMAPPLVGYGANKVFGEGNLPRGRYELTPQPQWIRAAQVAGLDIKRAEPSLYQIIDDFNTKIGKKKGSGQSDPWDQPTADRRALRYGLIKGDRNEVKLALRALIGKEEIKTVQELDKVKSYLSPYSAPGLAESSKADFVAYVNDKGGLIKKKVMEAAVEYERRQPQMEKMLDEVALEVIKELQQAKHTKTSDQR